MLILYFSFSFSSKLIKNNFLILMYRLKCIHFYLSSITCSCVYIPVIEKKVFKLAKFYKTKQILVVTENPGILYSYTTRKQIFNQPRILMVYEHELAAPIETYVWNKTYSECTKSCAGGFI